MADRIQARAIRRCGELLKQIEPAAGTRTDIQPDDGGGTRLTRKQAATEAGLSERQRVTALPMTFPERRPVDYAELVWRRLDDQTQQQTAEALGWSKQKTHDYANLRKIDADAWHIVSATVRGIADQEENADADSKSATADFTEGLLRNILDLRPVQQLSLCRRLANAQGYDGPNPDARFGAWCAENFRTHKDTILNARQLWQVFGEPNPDARFGAWVSTNFGDTSQQQIHTCRQLWQGYDGRLTQTDTD